MLKFLLTTLSSIKKQKKLQNSKSEGSTRSNLQNKSASSSSTIEIEILHEDYDNFPLSQLKEVYTFIESNSNLKIKDFNKFEFKLEEKTKKINYFSSAINFMRSPYVSISNS